MNQAIISKTGDAIPQNAIVNGQQMYVYEMMASGKYKCAGYATPTGVEIVRERGREIKVVGFAFDADIPNIIA